MTPGALQELRLEATYTRLPEALYTRLSPTPVRSPELVLYNTALARELGLPDLEGEPTALAAFLAGNRMPPEVQPFAQAYAGHQFGHFTVLGDGRAHVLGEALTPSGRRFDLQLKGSGPTPYSRQGDGRAALGPMLREYVISEAMHALGIPTTRSLAVVGTGEPVYRETVLDGAVLTRVAASHLRVGTFQFAAMVQPPGVLGALLDYAVERHFPGLQESENRALAFFEEVLDRQADLVVHWLRVGFIHGVMNTDNCAISGETLDYGPCAFMDAFHPGQVFSSIDRQGRYAFMNQARIAQWNLARLAETLLPLVDPVRERAVEQVNQALEGFRTRLDARWLEMMRTKLGLAGEEAGDPVLVDDLLAWMQRTGADYTNTFSDLARAGALRGEAGDDPAFQSWRGRWDERRGRNPGDPGEIDRRARLANPVLIPRNHKVEEALEAATEHRDLGPLRALLEVLARPYEERPGLEAWQAPPGPEARFYRTFCGT